MELFNDGGTYITFPILILLVIIVALFVKAIVSKGNYIKTKELLVSLGWFTIAWGYLGRTIGLIQGFNNIQAVGDISPSMLSGHLKMALIGPLFGIIVFLIARLGILILIWMQKEKAIEN